MCQRRHKVQNPAWAPDHRGADFLCTIHGGLAKNCECPPLEVWDEMGINPYFSGGELAPRELNVVIVGLGFGVAEAC